jgi:GNAT superfamily N-acetyltransferase
LLSVRRLTPADWRDYRELRLRALEDSPDAFGSLLEYEQPRADADWQQRVDGRAGSALQFPVVAVHAGAAVGLAWGRIDPAHPDVAHLYQMWVAPEHRRGGAGAMLLDAVINWARAAGARRVALRVTIGNSSATRLYTRAGFQAGSEREPLRPGSPILTQPMHLDLRTG